MTTTNVFEPVHAAHAIEQVLWGMQFVRPLNPEEFSRLMQATAAFSSKLPGRQEIRGMSFAVGPGGVSQVLANQQGAPDGLVLSFTAPTGALEKELRIDQNGIAFRNLSYTRWGQAWGEVCSYFQPLMQAIGDGIGVGTYQLQYVDKLIWNGPIDEIDVKEGLKKGSKYLALDIFDQKDLWHCHTGKFVRASDFAKRLMQINCDCLDEPAPTGGVRRAIRITAVVSDMLNHSGFEPRPSGLQLNEVESNMIELHDLHLHIITDIVSEAVGSRIGLNSDD